MRRVYAVWFLRKVTSPLFIKVYIMLALIFELFKSVSFFDVIDNMVRVPFFNIANYLLLSFTKTELSVQIYIFLFVLFAIWLFYDKRLQRQTNFAS